MATLGLRIQRDFPRYYKFFSTRKLQVRQAPLWQPQPPAWPGQGRRRHQDRLHPGIGLQPAVVHGSQQPPHGCRCAGRQVRPVAQRLHDQDPAPRHCQGNPLKQPHCSSCGQAQAGYNPAAAARVVAMAKPASPIKNPPVPRAKPEDLVPAPVAQPKLAATTPVSVEEMQKLAAKAEAATAAPKSKSVTELALNALPANGVTFKSVTVPSATAKGDSLIVASAAQALAPAPAAKIQKRIAAAGPVQQQTRAPSAARSTSQPGPSSSQIRKRFRKSWLNTSQAGTSRLVHSQQPKAPRAALMLQSLPGSAPCVMQHHSSWLSTRTATPSTAPGSPG
jgi:hypothetical protein